MTNGNEIGGYPIRAPNKCAAFWIRQSWSVSLSGQLQRGLVPGHVPSASPPQTLLPTCPHVCLSGGCTDIWAHHRLCSWRVGFSEGGGGCGSCLGAPSHVSCRCRHVHTDSEARQLYLRGTHGSLGCGPYMHTSEDDVSLLPKALRGSQAPKGGTRPLSSSRSQSFVAPGAPGVSAKP